MDNGQDSKWLILKDGQEIGPVDFYGVIRLIQQNKIHSMDFIKKVGEKSWSQVADNPDFQLQKFKSLSDSVLGALAPLSNRRRYDRFQVGEKILLNHLNTNVWAQMSEIGSGGVGVETIYGLLNVSETMKVHLKINGVSINALAKVVSKRDWKNPVDNTFVFRYGLKFVQFDSKSEHKLKQVIDDLRSTSSIAA